MRSLISICLGLFMALSAGAETVVISGESIDYAGKMMAAVTNEDEFSGKRILLASIEISEKGSFTLSFDLKETRRIFLKVNRVEAVMYAEPGHRYDVIFPSDASANIKRFDRTEVELEFVNLSANDLNQLIRNFNADYSDFIAEHYYDFASGEYKHADTWLKTRGDSKTKVDLYKPSEAKDSTIARVQPEFNKYVLQFKKETKQKYSDQGSAFFNDYLNYSIAEIDFLAGMKRENFYRDYFMSRILALNNPAFVNCFKMFYSGFLTRNSTEKQNAIIKAININKSPAEILKLYENDSTCLSSDVRNLALINGLKDLYNDKTYARRSIEKTIQGLVTSNDEIMRIAKNTVTQLQKRREDFQMENFTCLDAKMDKWILEEHHGHSVYLLFFATWSPTSLKEMQVMQKWHEKYGKFIEFVAVCMDDDYTDYKEFISKNRDFSFEILFGNADPLIAEKVMVFSIPEAVLLSEQGRTVYAHTRKPTEGIQTDFEKIMLTMKQNGTGPKTWKD